MRLPNLVGLALVAGVGLGACAHLDERGQSAEDESDEQAAAELREHHRHHQRGGVTQFIAMSLDTLGEDDAQRPQVEELQTSLRACLAPVRETRDRAGAALRRRAGRRSVAQREDRRRHRAAERDLVGGVAIAASTR